MSKSSLSKEVISANKKFYDMATEAGMICRCITIVHDPDKNKKRYICKEKFYDKNEKLIQYESHFDKSLNCVQVFTGKLHGGYIGIDLDVKGDNPDTVYEYEKILKKSGSNETETLMCVTPSGGRHYVYKLSKSQRTKLGDKKFGSQLGLFGYDIDVSNT